jgi:hypothetical protein
LANKILWQGPKYGYIWAGSNFICAIFFFLFIPEMKGRSLEELDELFDNRVSVRQFPTYQTQIQRDAVRDVQATIGAFKDKSEVHEETVERL